MAKMSPLRRRMIEDMTVRNLSPATQRSYLHAVTKFSRYFGRPPDQLGLEDVRTFQVHLVSTGISWPGLNQTVCALRFFYGVTLEHGEIPERIPYAREPRKLPVVLNADEVVRFLEAVPSLKTRAALTTAYAAGLRASEAVGLKVVDIDSGRMVIRVEQSKGGRDRYVMLSAQLLRILRTYWRLARPKDWLFPGRDESKLIDVQVLHAACRSARAAAGLAKRVTCIRCGTASPLIFWRAAPISASSKFCWVTATHVFTIGRVAEMLGENEDWLQDISIEMDPEDGCITVWGTGEETITAFTDLGVEDLAQLVEIYKADPGLMAPYPKPD